ncbi:MAG TPA: hypothetical protein PLO65_07955 [Caulobacter sp.]|nr:hypothetical protein [Caulobacter sp.]
MPRTVSILCAMAALALGSCVSRPVAPGFAWSYQNNAGEGPKLAYGAPASDNIVLMMTCQPGSQRVDLSLLGGSPRAGLVLASGDARQRLAGDLVAAPGLGQMIETSTHAASPPLARFARTGDLSLIDRGKTVRLDASPLERQGVSQFFEACAA